MHLIISSKLSHKLHCKETGWTKQTSARRLLPNTIIHWANFFVSVWIKPAAAADCNITCYGETAFSCCEAAAGITKRFSHNLSKTKQTQQVVTSHTHTHTHYGGQTKITEIRTYRHRDTLPRAVPHTGTPSVCTPTGRSDSSARHCALWQR